MRPLVYVVEDDDAIRQVIESLARTVGLDVRGFDSPVAFLEKYADAGGPRCVVVDLRLPFLSGLEVLSRLTATHQPVPVILLSGYLDVSSALQASKAGFFAILQKPFRNQDLLEEIQKALLHYSAQREGESRKEEIKARLATLTPREREVLDLLLEGHSSKGIGSKLRISKKTVDVHRGRIMKKLQASSPAHLGQLVFSARA